eukprot:SM000082S22807  [mRNA]  locus=s82:70157:71484:+ [translate_table: standard]
MRQLQFTVLKSSGLPATQPDKPGVGAGAAGWCQAQWLECVQEAGEALFVPSGWHHQVVNLEDTISINHNWINGCNIDWTWRLLQQDYGEAWAAIADIRDIADDFEALCQRNLAINTGLNCSDFWEFLRAVATEQAHGLRPAAAAIGAG